MLTKRHFLLIEALLKAPQGLSRSEVNAMLASEGEKPFPRQSFCDAIASIACHTGLHIVPHNHGKNVWRYSIDRQLCDDNERAQYVGIMVANLLQTKFLQEFRDLRDSIQPLQIARGNEYLHSIGLSLRQHHKLRVEYQKFDAAPTTCILHPYCLKAFGGRWYLFAHKEHSEHPDLLLQNFALDRILSLTPLQETFCPDERINIKEYFRDSYGVWVNSTDYPPHDITVACTSEVAHYLRTLPLHHTQQEITNATVATASSHPFRFRLHISLTPDFIGELRRWGERLVIVEEEKQIP